MATLDFDDYLGAYDDIKKRGEVLYALRQDVPARIFLGVARIKSIPQRLDAIRADTSLSEDEQASAAEKAFDDFYHDYHLACLAIVRHSYPAETGADLRAKLSEDEQVRLVTHFFTRPQSSLSQPDDATTATSAASESTTIPTSQHVTPSTSGDEVAARRKKTMATRH